MVSCNERVGILQYTKILVYCIDMSTVNTHNMTRLFFISPCLGDTEYNVELLETKLFDYRFCNKPKS